MDFRNPPGHYDPNVHKRRHDENPEKGLVWNTVNLLITVAIIVLVINLIRLF
ncbi:hypothetical protein J23TS9_13620 [Paenibacillus sp. J23TS9]|uniref:hypothetical protein n=1 Tax=Paenibacillus sp. J23TS9 TaxID=2807193 RepID=UPI001B2E0061|nr:hypothetical protein [Paenibacillus sp. J23TS9]GIP26232.1 hypothetical protein J23TS9_13620 [Paenibacillus sp. J23TS9]